MKVVGNELAGRESSRSVDQMKMPPLLTLDVVDRAVGYSLLGLSVQRHADRKAARSSIANEVNAADGLALRPMITCWSPQRGPGSADIDSFLLERFGPAIFDAQNTTKGTHGGSLQKERPI
jgi:hypothetical protein